MWNFAWRVCMANVWSKGKSLKVCSTPSVLPFRIVKCRGRCLCQQYGGKREIKHIPFCDFTPSLPTSIQFFQFKISMWKLRWKCLSWGTLRASAAFQTMPVLHTPPRLPSYWDTIKQWNDVGQRFCCPLNVNPTWSTDIDFEGKNH